MRRLKKTGGNGITKFSLLPAQIAYTSNLIEVSHVLSKETFVAYPSVYAYVDPFFAQSVYAYYPPAPVAVLAERPKLYGPYGPYTYGPY